MQHCFPLLLILQPNRQLSPTHPMCLGCTFILDRNLSGQFTARENVSVSKPKNWVRLRRSVTSKSLSLAVILRPWSCADSVSLKPQTFGWHLNCYSNRAFSWCSSFWESVVVSTSVILIVTAVPQREQPSLGLLSPHPTILDSRGLWSSERTHGREGTGPGRESHLGWSSL